MPRHTSFRDDLATLLLNKRSPPNALISESVSYTFNAFDISWMNSFFVMHDSLHVIHYQASLATLQWQQLMIVGVRMHNLLWQAQFEYMHLYISSFT